MRVKGNSTVPFAVMGGVLLGIGLLFSVETARFLDQALTAEGTVRFTSRARYLGEYREPYGGRSATIWVKGPWWTSVLYWRGDHMTFAYNPAAADRDWIPFIGGFFPSARISSWVSLWLSGFLLSTIGAGCLILAWLSAKFPSSYAGELETGRRLIEQSEETVRGAQTA